ncbi:MAG: AraC-like DNA-binding protein [Paraglaciecola psychrophila]|jgi:AraC-like DNA-binding protein
MEHYLANPAICLPGLKLAREKGLDSAPMLSDMGLSQSLSEKLLKGHLLRVDTAEFLSTTQQLQFLKNLQHCFEDPAIGLTIGQSANFADLGILGLTMLSAESLRQAMLVGALYSRIGGTLNHIQCVENNGNLVITVSSPMLDPYLQRYIVEEQFSAFAQYIGELLHHQVACDSLFEKLSFCYPEPAYSDRYREHFRCPIDFNSERNECWISRNILDIPAAYANAASFSACSVLCQNAMDSLLEKDAIIRELKSWLTSLPREFPKLAQAASKLGMNSRALRRKLEELDTSFMRLVAETKAEQAMFFLKKADLTIQDISDLLGYSEVTNFRRAFKSWTGITPQHYRQSPHSSNYPQPSLLQCPL